MDVRPEAPALPPTAPTIKRTVKPLAESPEAPAPRPRSRPSDPAFWTVVTAVAAFVTIGLVGLVVMMALNGPRRGAPRLTEPQPEPDSAEPDKAPGDRQRLVTRTVTPRTERKPMTSAGASPERKRVAGDRTRSLDGEHVYRAAFAPDGKTYATGGDRNTIRIFNTDDGDLVRSMKQEGWVQSLRFSGDGTRLFSVGYCKCVYTWDVATGAEMGRVEVPDFKDLNDVVFAPDGRLGICLHAGGNLALWDLTAGTKLHGLPRILGCRLLLHAGRPGRGDPELLEGTGPLHHPADRGPE